MIIADIMTQNVISVNPDASISSVAELMFDGNLTGLPVVDDSNHLVGIVTEYDLVSKHEHFHIPTYTKMLGQFKIPLKDDATKRELSSVQSLAVGDIMTLNVVTLFASEDVSKAASIFTQQRINPLPVVDHERKVVGIVSRADLVKLLKR